MEVLNWILGGFTLASVLGTLAASFYGVRSKTIIVTLEASNKAYKERNEILEQQIKDIIADNAKKIAELQGRVAALESIKTPPLQPLIKLVESNHKEVMKAITGSK